MDSLEALNIIKNNKGKAFCEAYEEPLNAIEKDLKCLEDLLDDKLELVIKNKQQDILITKLLQENEKLKQENKELLVNKNVAQGIATKYKKALDILKRFNFEFQFDCYYLVANDRTAIKGTLEELQLVKEVLENEN